MHEGAVNPLNDKNSPPSSEVVLPFTVTFVPSLCAITRKVYCVVKANGTAMNSVPQYSTGKSCS